MEWAWFRLTPKPKRLALSTSRAVHLAPGPAGRAFSSALMDPIPPLSAPSGVPGLIGRFPASDAWAAFANVGHLCHPSPPGHAGLPHGSRTPAIWKKDQGPLTRPALLAKPRQGVRRHGVRLGATPHGPPSLFSKQDHKQGDQRPLTRPALFSKPGKINHLSGGPSWWPSCSSRPLLQRATEHSCQHTGDPAQATARANDSQARAGSLAREAVADTGPTGLKSTANDPARHRCRRQTHPRPRHPEANDNQALEAQATSSSQARHPEETTARRSASYGRTAATKGPSTTAGLVQEDGCTALASALTGAEGRRVRAAGRTQRAPQIVVEFRRLNEENGVPWPATSSASAPTLWPSCPSKKEARTTPSLFPSCWRIPLRSGAETSGAVGYIGNRLKIHENGRGARVNIGELSKAFYTQIG